MLDVINRRRSGSFCFRRNQWAGLGEEWIVVTIEGVLDDRDFSQQELIERLNSGMRYH